MWLCVCVYLCVCHICWRFSHIFLLKEERITRSLSLRLSLCLPLRPPESYSCHSVTFPIHNWGLCTAQSPWNHVNHFQLLLLNNQAEPKVPGGNMHMQLPVSLTCVISSQLTPVPQSTPPPQNQDCSLTSEANPVLHLSNTRLLKVPLMSLNTSFHWFSGLKVGVAYSEHCFM